MFSDTTLPNPISLALTLRENRDERVEQAVELIMDDLWEGKHGSWIRKF